VNTFDPEQKEHKKSMAGNRNRVAALVAAAAVVGGGAGAGAVALTHSSGSSHTATGTTATATSSPTVSNVSSTTLTIGQVAKASLRSVVEIDSTSGSGQQAPFGQGSSTAEGTGWVYDARGDIVTNEHVVDGASSVKVKFSDGSTYKGTIVGTDISTDLAVVHVNAPSSKLVPLQLGDSGTAEIGDPVIAIGNPFGLDGTVTSGIVSATNREISAPDETPIEGAIQTDAAINHGNSGGPLLNLSGRVIGVTSQIQSDSGGNEGVGFAIPVNTVRTIADELISSGKAQHALLGISPGNATNGARVESVEAGSAASDAGLKVGDVITSVDGSTVTSSMQLRAIIAGHKPGDKVTVNVRRNGSTLTLHATLGSRS
jgi:putative serine protease PepD